MRIQCPSCETVYNVPDQTVAAGRKVQCAQCGVKWAPAPPPVLPPMPRPAPPVMPAPAVPPPLPATPSFPAIDPAFVISPWPVIEPAPPGSWARRQRPWGLIAAWAGSLALVAAIVALAIIERGTVMNAWPPSTRLFAMLGLR